MDIEKSKEEIIREVKILIVEYWSWLNRARDKQACDAYRMSNIPREQLAAWAAPLTKKLDEFERQLARTMASVDKLK